MKNKDVVKFSRLLYKDYFNVVIEFEVNGEMKLWYNISNYQGWDKPDNFNEVLSDYCILQNQKDLSFLFFNSPITHFEKDISNQVDVYCMFKKCKDLIYFKSRLNDVRNINYIFLGCSDKFFQKHPHLRDL